MSRLVRNVETPEDRERMKVGAEAPDLLVREAGSRLSRGRDPYKQVIALIIGFAALLVGLLVATLAVRVTEYVDWDEAAVIACGDGTDTHVVDGIDLVYVGACEVTVYDTDTRINLKDIPVVFRDGSKGEVSIFMRVELPSDHDQLLELHDMLKNGSMSFGFFVWTIRRDLQSEVRRIASEECDDASCFEQRLLERFRPVLYGFHGVKLHAGRFEVYKAGKP